MQKEKSIKREAVIMAMPVTVEISKSANLQINRCNEDIEKVFEYLRWVDETFSPFKKTSEVSKYNRGDKYSRDLANILRLAQDTKSETNGYFDIVRPDGKMDPSGIVKGWAIKGGADILRKLSYKRFYVDIAGDAEIVGESWKWGIRNPFNKNEIVKVLDLSNLGIATSGTYEHGQHIWDPVTKKSEITDIVSLTVIAKNVYEADRFATPAFAMGRAGIQFIESHPGLEGYMIDKDGIATMTGGFDRFVEDPSTRSTRSG